MEKVPFVLINGKTRLMKRKMADHLERRGKGHIYVEPEINATPAVTDEAERMGINLRNVEGSGRDGKILKRDLRDYQTRMLKAQE